MSHYKVNRKAAIAIASRMAEVTALLAEAGKVTVKVPLLDARAESACVHLLADFGLNAIPEDGQHGTPEIAWTFDVGSHNGRWDGDESWSERVKGAASAWQQITDLLSAANPE